MGLYEIWNNIILDFFFKDHCDEEIFLSVDYDELIDYADQSHKLDDFVEKFNNARISRGERILPKKEHISTLFRQIFTDKGNPDISYLLNLIKIKTKDKSTDPQTLPLLALFMMPIANRPDLNSNNYYTKTTEFLHEKNIIKSKECLSCTNFSKVKVELNSMWEQLETWATKNNYYYHVKTKSTNERNSYVAPFLAEAVLSAVQRMLFKRVFYKAGLVVGQNLSREKILHILREYGAIITYNDKKKLDQKLNEYESAMTSAFMQAYSKWDGTTFITKTSEKEHQKRFEYEYDGSVNRLYLSMSSYHGEYKFSIIANIHNSENCELFEYTGEFGDYEFYVDDNGIADDTKCSEKIISAISNGKEIVFFNRCGNNDSLRYIPDELILLEAYHSKFISKVTINKGGHYFVLLKKGQELLHKDWLNQNNAISHKSHNLYNGYNLFEIKSLQTVMADSPLKLQSRKYIQLKSTIIVGREDGITLLYDGMPAYFVIEGIDIVNDQVRAVFNSDGLIEEEILEYCADLRLWKLPVVNKPTKKAKTFTIYVGTERLSTSSYRFYESHLPNEYNEISFNEFGEYQANLSIFNGLRISDKINVNLSELANNMRKYGTKPQFTQFEYVHRDHLLYALSAHPIVDKKFVDVAISALVANNLEKSKEGLTKIIIDYYCRMGYINYAYSKNKHMIAVNKPTLIWLPSVFSERAIISNQERVSATLTIKNCTESYFKFLLTGARTPLLIDKLIDNAQKNNITIQIDEFKSPLYPQRILLWSETIESVRQLAEEIDIQFENCVYASSMLKKLSDVDMYLKHITQEESDKDYGGIQNNLCGYDYTATEGKAFVTRSKAINKETDVITYFPGTYSSQTVLWHKEKQYDIDLLWSFFVGMKLANHKVVQFDKNNSVITMPKHFKLPMLYARALTMITGEISPYVNNLRQYKVANNPFTKSVDGNEILKKLGQF